MTHPWKTLMRQNNNALKTACWTHFHPTRDRALAWCQLSTDPQRCAAGLYQFVGLLNIHEVHHLKQEVIEKVVEYNEDPTLSRRVDIQKALNVLNTDLHLNDRRTLFYI